MIESTAVVLEDTAGREDVDATDASGTGADSGSGVVCCKEWRNRKIRGALMSGAAEMNGWKSETHSGDLMQFARDLVAEGIEVCEAAVHQNPMDTKGVSFNAYHDR